MVPVYNVEKYLRECIQSVLDQDFNDYEIICINDGSTDGSLDIILSFDDQRIK
ncbi:TPA: glycosyltransferase family 2 protein [Escherichia coli]